MGAPLTHATVIDLPTILRATAATTALFSFKHGDGFEHVAQFGQVHPDVPPYLAPGMVSDVYAGHAGARFTGAALTRANFEATGFLPATQAVAALTLDCIALPRTFTDRSYLWSKTGTTDLSTDDDSFHFTFRQSEKVGVAVRADGVGAAEITDFLQDPAKITHIRFLFTGDRVATHPIFGGSPFNLALIIRQPGETPTFSSADLGSDGVPGMPNTNINEMLFGNITTGLVACDADVVEAMITAAVLLDAGPVGFD